MWFSKKQKRGWSSASNKKKSRKSAFGGEVKSQEEIENLKERIRLHEELELQEFEDNFDEAWEKTKKK